MMQPWNYSARWASAALVLLACLLSGCGSVLPELVPFGAVQSPDHLRSPNGLGVHRRMWETTGAKVLTPQKLSPRLETMDTIVLVGQTFDPPGQAAREWLERWLAGEKGRTVIYFGRDFNANAYYRRQTLDNLSAGERIRGEQLLASVEAKELSLMLREIPENTFCEWFYLDRQQPRRAAGSLRGSWGSSLNDLEGEWPVRVTLQPPRRSLKDKQPSWLTTNAQQPLDPNAGLPTGNGEVERSIWTANELDTPEKWDEAFEDLLQSEALLVASDGTPLVFSLTHPERFPGSQILIVANGAPFLNASLVEPLHQRVGEKIIAAALPAERVALLAYDNLGILISNTPEADPRGAGLEMLTTWPLSAITMPAALLGIIVCAVLFPILGRPARPRQRSVTDFGLHTDAIGRMLQDSRDATFARSVLTEYFVKVRGESPPGWFEGMFAREEQRAGRGKSSAHNNPAPNNLSPSSPVPSSPVAASDTKKVDGAVLTPIVESTSTADNSPPPFPAGQLDESPPRPQLPESQLPESTPAAPPPPPPETRSTE